MKIRRIVLFLGLLGVIIILLYKFSRELAWLNTQYGLLITISVSVLIPWLTSERWVEQYRLKREHSMKLAEESLGEWKNGIDVYTKLEAVPNDESYIYEAVEPFDPSALPYFIYLEEHLKTGHPLMLKLWLNLKSNHTRINEYKVKILENIRQTIINDNYLEGLELAEHHFRKSRVHRVSPPIQYYAPDSITESIFDEIEYLIQYNHHQDPSIFEEITENIRKEEGLMQAFQLKYSTRILFRTLNKDNIRILKGWFISLSERNELIQQVGALHKEIFYLNELKDEFIRKVDELIWYVQLGNNLKGNCPYCPPGTLSSIWHYFVG